MSTDVLSLTPSTPPDAPDEPAMEGSPVPPTPDHTSDTVATADDAGDLELDRPITTGWLLRFALPTVLYYVISNLFMIADGIFAARVISPVALGAVQVVLPFINVAHAVTFTLSIGGAALVGKQLGEGEQARARRTFTLLTTVLLVSTVTVAAFALLFPSALASLLGADDALRPFVYDYLRPLALMLPFAGLGMFLAGFFPTEGKPDLALYASIVGGLANLGLNFLLIWHLGWGLRGAAIATGIGWGMPALFGLWTFARKSAVLRWTRPGWDWAALRQSATNGVSEAVSLLAPAVTVLVMNRAALDLAGTEGVAAVAIATIGIGFFSMASMGYAYGISPIVSFNHGASNFGRLRQLLRTSVVVTLIGAAVMTVLGLALAHPISLVYVPAGTEVHTLAVDGIRLGMIGMPIMAFNIFAITWFTALNNGKVSGGLSLARTFVFLLATLLVLPRLMGLTGLWLAIPAAEALGLTLSIAFLAWSRRRLRHDDAHSAAVGGEIEE